MPAVATHQHGLDTISGYVVRATFPGTDRSHVDVEAFDGATSYSDALALASRIRRGPNSGRYAVVDPLYNCGCRGRG